MPRITTSAACSEAARPISFLWPHHRPSHPTLPSFCNGMRDFQSASISHCATRCARTWCALQEASACRCHEHPHWTRPVAIANNNTRPDARMSGCHHHHQRGTFQSLHQPNVANLSPSASRCAHIVIITASASIPDRPPRHAVTRALRACSEAIIPVWARGIAPTSLSVPKAAHTIG